MGTFILKRKTFSLLPSFNPHAPKARIQAIEACPYVDEDYEVINPKNILVDENAILKLFMDPKKFIIPKIYEYEREYQQGQGLMEKDYEETGCSRVEVSGPRDIDFYVQPIPGSRVYRQYGPTFRWHLIADLKGTNPEVEIFDGFGEF